MALVNLDEQTDQPLSEKVALRIREMLIQGRFTPGEKLSEHQVAGQFGISPNTLREAPLDQHFPDS